MTSHHDTLGVSESASADEIRRAYLSKARELHPDRHARSDEARRRRAERDMQQVNEAFTALTDSEGRRSSGPGEPSTGWEASSNEDADTEWRAEEPERFEHAPMFHMMRALPLLIVLGTLAALFVFTAFASGNRLDDERRVELISPGDCVTTAGTTMTWVPCDGSTTGIVQAIVAAEADCIARNGTTPMPMPDGKGFACLEPAGDKERP